MKKPDQISLMLSPGTIASSSNKSQYQPSLEKTGYAPTNCFLISSTINPRKRRKKKKRKRKKKKRRRKRNKRRRTIKKRSKSLKKRQKNKSLRRNNRKRKRNNLMMMDRNPKLN